MLLELAPGLRIVRRGRAHLQIGLHDPRRVVLPHSRATTYVLDRLVERRPLDLDLFGVAAVAARLIDSGCAIRADGADSPQTPGSSRGGLGVAVLEDAGEPDRLDVGAALRAAGLTVVSRLEDCDVVLAAVVGELERDRLDGLLRRRTPHLLVRLVDGVVVLGPFVVPGQTACLRCLDAHAAEADPDHLPVLSRYVVASRAPRPDGRADLVAPAIAQLALAWAARDLLAHADGQRPSTWSTTVRLGPRPGDEARHVWERHPECGCCWQGDARSSGRMEE